MTGMDFQTRFRKNIVVDSVCLVYIKNKNL